MRWECLQLSFGSVGVWWVGIGTLCVLGAALRLGGLQRRFLGALVRPAGVSVGHRDIEAVVYLRGPWVVVRGAGNEDTFGARWKGERGSGYHGKEVAVQL